MKTLLVALAFALGSIGPMAQQDDTIYRPGNDVSVPKLVKELKPQYTADAMRRRVTGFVLLQCVVERDGVPGSLEIVQSLDTELDQVALDALKQWRFEPGTKDGKAVRVRIEVQMAFTTK